MEFGKEDKGYWALRRLCLSFMYTRQIDRWPTITKDTSVEEVNRIHRMIWRYVLVTGVKPYTPYIFDSAIAQYLVEKYEDDWVFTDSYMSRSIRCLFYANFTGLYNQYVRSPRNAESSHKKFVKKCLAVMNTKLTSQ